MDMNPSNVVADLNLITGKHPMSALNGNSMEGLLYANLQFAKLLNRMRQILMQQWPSGSSDSNPKAPGNSGSGGQPSTQSAGWISGHELIRREFGVEPVADGVYPRRADNPIAANPPPGWISGQELIRREFGVEPVADGAYPGSASGPATRSCRRSSRQASRRCHQHGPRHTGETTRGGLIGNLFNEMKRSTANDPHAFQFDNLVQIINNNEITYNIVEFDT